MAYHECMKCHRSIDYGVDFYTIICDERISAAP